MERIGDIVESIANEKNLDLKDVKDRVITAFINTVKYLFGDNYQYDVEFSQNMKDIKISQKVTVVEDNDEKLTNNTNYIGLSKAKELDPDIEISDEIKYPINLESMGRTASQKLSKELNYHIQKLVDETVFKKYHEQIGEIIFGNVIRIDSEETTYLEFDDIKVYMPRKNRIKGEKFKIGDVVRAVIRKVYMEKNQGIKIEISRTSPKFLEALLRLEVPEIKDGSVIIHSCARIPGERAKLALTSTKSTVDPAGATIGTKGVRINAISKELNGENIDVFEYSPRPEIFVTRAISPAIINSVKIDGAKAFVNINPEQKSKAIGKNGINIKLASLICSMEIILVENQKTTDSESGLKGLKSLFGDI